MHRGPGGAIDPGEGEAVDGGGEVAGPLGVSARIPEPPCAPTNRVLQGPARGSHREHSVEAAEPGTAVCDASVYYDVRAELSPENVDLYFDGTLVYSGDAGCDNFYRTGDVGLQVHQDHVAWFDEVCVEW